VRATAAWLVLATALVGVRAAWTPGTAAPPVVVELGGDVAHPGVWILPAGTEVEQAVARAGGDAIPDAARVVDGERLEQRGGAGVTHMEPLSALLLGRHLDVNTATAAELEAVPGLGPSRAEAILAEREANGVFSGVDDLERVRGIGPATVADLGEWVTARGGPSVARGPSPHEAETPRSREDARPAHAGPIDVNSATPEQLCALPGVGPVLAEAIRKDREIHGRFRSLEDLDRVKGIGPARLVRLQGRVIFGEGRNGG